MTTMPTLHQHEMNLLFTTRFSESCFQTIRAVAQWLDDVPSSLTIAHVYDPRRTDLLHAERQLHSFFAEADRYARTRRVLLEGRDAARTIADHMHDVRYDMLVCPASDRVGLMRPFHRSTRARVLARSPATVWTMGEPIDQHRFAKPKRIGCIISRRSDSYRQLELSCEYALRTGATLQLMYILPEIHEGTLRNDLSFNEPLSAVVARADLERIAAVLPVTPELHIAPNSDFRSVVRMLRSAHTDLVFVGKEQALQTSIWGARLAEYIDASECPVVCVDQDRALPGWRLRKPTEVNEQLRELAIAWA